jgi:hypothetical protein
LGILGASKQSHSSKLLLINWRKKMKTTNKFKYAFIMIGYVALLSLAQHAKSDSSTFAIEPDGSVRIKSSFDPVAVIRNQHTQKFNVTCPVQPDAVSTYFGGAMKVKTAGVAADFDVSLAFSDSLNRDADEFAFGETKYIRHNEGFRLVLRVTGNTAGITNTVWLGRCLRSDTGAIVPLTLGNVTQN